MSGVLESFEHWDECLFPDALKEVPVEFRSSPEGSFVYQTRVCSMSVHQALFVSCQQNAQRAGGCEAASLRFKTPTSLVDQENIGVFFLCKKNCISLPRVESVKRRIRAGRCPPDIDPSRQRIKANF